MYACERSGGSYKYIIPFCCVQAAVNIDSSLLQNAGHDFSCHFEHSYLNTSCFPCIDRNISHYDLTINTCLLKVKHETGNPLQLYLKETFFFFYMIEELSVSKGAGETFSQKPCRTNISIHPQSQTLSSLESTR